MDNWRNDKPFVALLRVFFAMHDKAYNTDMKCVFDAICSSENMTLDQLAAKCYMSPSTFYRRRKTIERIVKRIRAKGIFLVE